MIPPYYTAVFGGWSMLSCRVWSQQANKKNETLMLDFQVHAHKKFRSCDQLLCQLSELQALLKTLWYGGKSLKELATKPCVGIVMSTLYNLSE